MIPYKKKDVWNCILFSLLKVYFLFICFSFVLLQVDAVMPEHTLPPMQRMLVDSDDDDEDHYPASYVQRALAERALADEEGNPTPYNSFEEEIQSSARCSTPKKEFTCTGCPIVIDTESDEDSSVLLPLTVLRSVFPDTPEGSGIPTTANATLPPPDMYLLDALPTTGEMFTPRYIGNGDEYYRFSQDAQCLVTEEEKREESKQDKLREKLTGFYLDLLASDIVETISEGGDAAVSPGKNSNEKCSKDHPDSFTIPPSGCVTDDEKPSTSRGMHSSSLNRDDRLLWAYMARFEKKK